METIDLSLPDDLTEWVEAQVQAGRYSTASAYVGELIRRDQERKAKVADLQALLTEGIESGTPAPFDVDDFLRSKHGTK